MKAKEQQILDSVLSHVPQEGWTVQAFALGLGTCGMAASEARKLAPQGIADVVELFHISIDETMQAQIRAKRNFPALRVREKVAFAVRARLEAIKTNREAMRRLIVWSLLPRNISRASKHLWQAADAIWIAAGDTSTDYNHYTKRVLLSAIMKSTLSFWLNDTSPDSYETWAFLDRRINDVMKIGKSFSFVRSRFVA